MPTQRPCVPKSPAIIATLELNKQLCRASVGSSRSCRCGTCLSSLHFSELSPSVYDTYVPPVLLTLMNKYGRTKIILFGAFWHNGLLGRLKAFNLSPHAEAIRESSSKKYNIATCQHAVRTSNRERKLSSSSLTESVTMRQNGKNRDEVPRDYVCLLSSQSPHAWDTYVYLCLFISMLAYVASRTNRLTGRPPPTSEVIGVLG